MSRMNKFIKFLVVVCAIGLMGQANNCKELNTILPKLGDIFQPGSGSTGNAKIYIANLSFMDTETKSVANIGDAEPLNEAVLAGMKAISASDPKYVINDAKRTVQNNDANAKMLSDIYFDFNITRLDKIDRIITQLMVPNGVDGLLFGQITEKQDGTYSVRPIGLSLSTKNMVTESLIFQKTEFKCKDPANPARNILCQKAHETIKDAVMNIIKNL
jgi:hypothetical protein